MRVVFFFFFCWSLSLQAKSKDQLLSEFFKTVEIEKEFNHEIQQGLDLILQENMSFVVYRSDLQNFAIKHMSWQSIEPRVRDMYRAQYSSKELKDLIVFFKTETGKKFARTGPRLNMQVARLAQDQARRKLPEFFRRLQERGVSSEDNRTILEKIQDQ